MSRKLRPLLYLTHPTLPSMSSLRAKLSDALMLLLLLLLLLLLPLRLAMMLPSGPTPFCAMTSASQLGCSSSHPPCTWLTLSSVPGLLRLSTVRRLASVRVLPEKKLGWYWLCWAEGAAGEASLGA